jgi:hypothetical protein
MRYKLRGRRWYSVQQVVALGRPEEQRADQWRVTISKKGRKAYPKLRWSTDVSDWVAFENYEKKRGVEKRREEKRRGETRK